MLNGLESTVIPKDILYICTYTQHTHIHTYIGKRRPNSRNISNKKPLLAELWEGKRMPKTSFHAGLLEANADTNTDKAGQ